MLHKSLGSSIKKHRETIDFYLMSALRLGKSAVIGTSFYHSGSVLATDTPAWLFFTSSEIPKVTEDIFQRQEEEI